MRHDDVPAASPVRPYLLTGGRVVRPGDLSLETQVVATVPGAHHALRFEPRAIAELAHAPLSVAEIAARLRLQVGVVRVLVSDLAAAGHLVVSGAASPPDVALLQRVIRGLRSLA